MSKPDFTSPEYLAKLRNSLRWDDERQEPYLQLPSFPDLRLTPFREGIEDEITTLFNHPVIGERLYRIPYPYLPPQPVDPADASLPFLTPLPSHVAYPATLLISSSCSPPPSMPRTYAEEWVTRDLTLHNSILTQLLTLLPSPPTSSQPLLPIPDKYILEMPFKSLRSISNFTNHIIGDINLHPHSYHFYEKPLTPEEVRGRPPPEQMWDFGYVLDPGWYGRGIASEMVGVILEGWVRPWMGIGRVGAFADLDNIASQRVLEKNGLVKVSEHTTDWPEDKGGGTRETGRFERSLL